MALKLRKKNKNVESRIIDSQETPQGLCGTGNTYGNDTSATQAACAQNLQRTAYNHGPTNTKLSLTFKAPAAPGSKSTAPARLCGCEVPIRHAWAAASQRSNCNRGIRVKPSMAAVSTLFAIHRGYSLHELQQPIRMRSTTIVE